jgi:ATP-binding cassette subfamily F protein 3
MEIEELLSLHHKELIEVSNSGDSATLIELSKTVSSEESQVEELFEELEVVQNELDEVTENYDEKMEELI